MRRLDRTADAAPGTGQSLGFFVAAYGFVFRIGTIAVVLTAIRLGVRLLAQ